MIFLRRRLLCLSFEVTEEIWLTLDGLDVCRWVGGCCCCWMIVQLSPSLEFPKGGCSPTDHDPSSLWHLSLALTPSLPTTTSTACFLKRKRQTFFLLRLSPKSQLLTQWDQETWKYSFKDTKPTHLSDPGIVLTWIYPLLFQLLD